MFWEVAGDQVYVDAEHCGANHLGRGPKVKCEINQADVKKDREEQQSTKRLGAAKAQQDAGNKFCESENHLKPGRVSQKAPGQPAPKNITERLRVGHGAELKLGLHQF